MQARGDFYLSFVSSFFHLQSTAYGGLLGSQHANLPRYQVTATGRNVSTDLKHHASARGDWRRKDGSAQRGPAPQGRCTGPLDDQPARDSQPDGRQ